MVIRGVVEEMENNSSAPLYPSLSHQFFVPHFSPLTIITFDVSMFHCTVYSHFVKCVWRERTTGNVCLIHFFLAFCFKFYSFPWKDFDISPLVPPNMFLFRLHRIKKKATKKKNSLFPWKIFQFLTCLLIFLVGWFCAVLWSYVIFILRIIIHLSVLSFFHYVHWTIFFCLNFFPENNIWTLKTKLTSTYSQTDQNFHLYHWAMKFFFSRMLIF